MTDSDQMKDPMDCSMTVLMDEFRNFFFFFFNRFFFCNLLVVGFLVTLTYQ